MLHCVRCCLHSTYIKNSRSADMIDIHMLNWLDRHPALHTFRVCVLCLHSFTMPFGILWPINAHICITCHKCFLKETVSRTFYLNYFQSLNSDLMYLSWCLTVYVAVFSFASMAWIYCHLSMTTTVTIQLLNCNVAAMGSVILTRFFLGKRFWERMLHSISTETLLSTFVCLLIVSTTFQDNHPTVFCHCMHFIHTRFIDWVRFREKAVNMLAVHYFYRYQVDCKTPEIFIVQTELRGNEKWYKDIP